MSEIPHREPESLASRRRLANDHPQDADSPVRQVIEAGEKEFGKVSKYALEEPVDPNSKEFKKYRRQSLRRARNSYIKDRFAAIGEDMKEANNEWKAARKQAGQDRREAAAQRRSDRAKFWKNFKNEEWAKGREEARGVGYDQEFKESRLAEHKKTRYSAPGVVDPSGEISRPEREFLARVKAEGDRRETLARSGYARSDSAEVANAGLKRVGEVAPLASNAPEFKEGAEPSNVFDVSLNALNRAFSNTEPSLRFALIRLLKHQDGESDDLYAPKNDQEKRQDQASVNLYETLQGLEQNYLAIRDRVKRMFEVRKTGEVLEPAPAEIAFVAKGIFDRMIGAGDDFAAAFEWHVGRVTENVAANLVREGRESLYQDLPLGQRLALRVLDERPASGENSEIATAYLRKILLQKQVEGPANQAERIASQAAEELEGVMAVFNDNEEFIKTRAEVIAGKPGVKVEPGVDRHLDADGYAFLVEAKMNKGNIPVNKAFDAVMRDVIKEKLNNALFIKVDELDKQSPSA